MIEKRRPAVQVPWWEGLSKKETKEFEILLTQFVIGAAGLLENGWEVRSMVSPRSRRLVSGPLTDDYARDTWKAAVRVETERLMLVDTATQKEPQDYIAYGGYIGRRRNKDVLFGAKGGFVLFSREKSRKVARSAAEVVDVLTAAGRSGRYPEVPYHLLLPREE